MNCKKTKCEKKPKTGYICNGNCTSIRKPCNDECPLENQVKCDDEFCYTKKELKDGGKWVCHGKCINLTDPCDGECAELNWEKNCQGTCELEQTFYDCNGTCQPVEEMCQGKCSSSGRSWKCPDNKSRCVSSYLCSIQDDLSKIVFANEAKQCPYVSNSYRKVCERKEGLAEFKCELPKVRCTGHRKQCVDRNSICNNELDCMDRSDESNCRRIDKDVDTTLFKECTLVAGNRYKELGKLANSGFKCGENICLDQSYWCSVEYRNSDWIDETLKEMCGNILDQLHNERFCRNSTFWRNKKCSDVRKSFRCNGNYPGECSRGPETACNGLAFSECLDKSDLVCKMQDTICSQNFTKKCSDGSKCVHKDLWCDGFKHCPDGSDENSTECSNCLQRHEDRFTVTTRKSDTEMASCKHEFSNIPICAVPCNGIDDLCKGHSDEENCKSLPLEYTALFVMVLICVTLVFGETVFRTGCYIFQETKV